MSSMPDYESIVLEHYRQQAQKLGMGKLCTMPDEIVREREVEAICQYISWFKRADGSIARVLDIGCGNGYTLSVLRRRFSDLALVGVDYSPEMIQLARARGLERCQIEPGDVRSLQFESGAFDIVLSERCIINLMDRGDQQIALHEIHRVLRNRGVCLFIEAFTDGLDNLNRARSEMGLDPIPMPYHNLFLDKEWFLRAVEGLFAMRRPSDLGDTTLPDHNFLSSHYFMSRVVHSCLSKVGDRRNTEFVKFFSFLPPIGNYASVQLFVLQKV